MKVKKNKNITHKLTNKQTKKQTHKQTHKQKQQHNQNVVFNISKGELVNTKTNGHKRVGLKRSILKSAFLYLSNIIVAWFLNYLPKTAQKFFNMFEKNQIR